MGYPREDMTGLGFRSMASRLLHEQGWNHHRNRESRAFSVALFLRFFRKIVPGQKTMNGKLLLGNCRINFVQAPPCLFVRHGLYLD